MEPASTIIDRLGGDSVVARAIGLHRTRVANWKRPKEKGGTGGRIPQGHIPALIDLAAQRGVEIGVAEFIQIPARQPVAAEPGQ